MKSWLNCCVVLMTCFFAACGLAGEHTEDSLETVKQKVDDKEAVLVDVRSQKEWDAGHVKGAIFLPLTEIKDGVSDEQKKKLPKDKILYTHCVKGVRALSAGKILSKLGYEVRVLKPGYKELKKAGFETEKTK